MPKKKKPSNKPGRPCKYPWRSCAAVGDKFEVKEEYQKVIFAMKKFVQRNKQFKFSATKIGSEKVLVERVA